MDLHDFLMISTSHDSVCCSVYITPAFWVEFMSLWTVKADCRSNPTTSLSEKPLLYSRPQQRRNEALPITKDQYIPDAIEIRFKSLDHPIDIIILTVLGFSLNFENQQLCFENEKVGLLLHL